MLEGNCDAFRWLALHVGLGTSVGTCEAEQE